MKRLRRFLVGGLLIWVPLGVTILVLKVLIEMMDRTLLLLPAAYRPETLFGFHIPGLGVLLTFLVLLLTGILVGNIIGAQILKGWESLLSRVPLIRTVYSAVKQVAETVLSDSDTSFKRVMLIEYPRKGLYSLCFQTAESLGEIDQRTDDDLICVFVPTTPNPTSGFIIMVAKEDVIELDMDVDEALKMVVSLGVVVPVWPRALPAEVVAKVKPSP